MARVVSVNIGSVRELQWKGRTVTTAIWKSPVHVPVRLAGVNLDGDDQADRRVHGGPDKAVYAYSQEDYELWRAAKGSLNPGTFGENLTTVGLVLNDSYIGDRWRVGSAVLEVAQPRFPCYKLGIRMDDDEFPEMFGEVARLGCYLRIIEAGEVQMGDSIEVEPAERPAVRIGDIAERIFDEQSIQLMATDARVPARWQKVALRELSD